MPFLRTLARGLSTQPGYTLMRGVARFAAVRHAVTGVRRAVQARRTAVYVAHCESHMGESLFAAADRTGFVQELRQNGIAFGLRLPAAMTAEIVAFAERTTCYANRNPLHGFKVQQHEAAQTALGQPVLLAQYFNAAAGCPAIHRLLHDPALQWIACQYLGSVPRPVGVNMWWTFPVKASEADRDLHAHLFHRDVDDFRFFKFFFYLTEVPQGEGAHICVVASHQQPPRTHRGDQWNIRRYSDAEIEASYPQDRILEICGQAGTGFAENTLCVHKGRTPETRARLLLQIQYALFDYGVMHDQQDAGALQTIV